MLQGKRHRTRREEKRMLLVSVLGTKTIEMLSGKGAPQKVNRLGMAEFYTLRPNKIASFLAAFKGG